MKIPGGDTGFSSFTNSFPRATSDRTVYPFYMPELAMHYCLDISTVYIQTEFGHPYQSDEVNKSSYRIFNINYILKLEAYYQFIQVYSID